MPEPSKHYGDVDLSGYPFGPVKLANAGPFECSTTLVPAQRADGTPVRHLGWVISFGRTVIGWGLDSDLQVGAFVADACNEKFNRGDYHWPERVYG